MGFRFFAIVLGLGICVVLELLLRFLGIGQAKMGEDPFIEFGEIRPLFARDASGKFFETATNRTNYFVRDRFPSTKNQRAFRVFCIGGSTVQGRPYSLETAFPKWLELALSARDKTRKWEVINCGGVSYASYRLVPILRECLEHEPDLIVLCVGQNEFLEDRSYADFKSHSRVFQSIQTTLHALHTTRFARQIVSDIRQKFTKVPKPKRTLLPAKVDAFLDYQNGLDAYHWNPDWRNGVIKHFENNLDRMAKMCQSVGVPLWLLSPPINLRNSPPFKSEHRADLSSQKLNLWKNFLKSAEDHFDHDHDLAIDFLKKAIDIDPQYAATYFVLGGFLEGMGRPNEARPFFVKAKEFDICPLRILESQRQIIKKIARRHRLPFADLHTLLENESEHFTLGSELLVDHIHPSIRGHQIIAKFLLDKFDQSGWLPHRPDSFSKTLSSRFQKHLDDLPKIYFFHGKMRLENLRLWAQGRAGKLPLKMKSTNDRR